MQPPPALDMHSSKVGPPPPVEAPRSQENVRNYQPTNGQYTSYDHSRYSGGNRSQGYRRRRPPPLGSTRRRMKEALMNAENSKPADDYWGEKRPNRHNNMHVTFVIGFQ